MLVTDPHRHGLVVLLLLVGTLKAPVAAPADAVVVGLARTSPLPAARPTTTLGPTHPDASTSDDGTVLEKLTTKRAAAAERQELR